MIKYTSEELASAAPPQPSSTVETAPQKARSAGMPLTRKPANAGKLVLGKVRDPDDMLDPAGNVGFVLEVA
jgi:hypothetical protein